MVRYSIHRGNRHNAFTLIEVFIAIGIIALLATMLVGVSGGMREKSSAAKCASNLRQIGVGLILYSGENDLRYPAVRKTNPSVYWYMALAPYVDGKLAGKSDFGDSLDIAEVFRCPAAMKDYGAPSEDVVYRTYMASDLMRSRDSGGVKSWQEGARPMSIDDKIRSVVCVDGARSGGDFAATSGTTWRGAKSLISYRHNGTANALFFDGHVEAVRPGDITADMWDAL